MPATPKKRARSKKDEGGGTISATKKVKKDTTDQHGIEPEVGVRDGAGEDKVDTV